MTWVAVSLKVLLCLYCVLVTLTAQPLLSGQPSLSVPAYLHLQVVLSQSVLGVLLSFDIRHCSQYGFHCALCLFRATYVSILFGDFVRSG